MASHTAFRGITKPLSATPLSSLLKTSTRPSTTSIANQCRATPSPATQSLLASAARAFSTSPAHHKRQQHGEKRDPKITALLQGLSTTAPERVPSPLRMARNRHLRHWTIHRAWLLLRRKRREARERELMRMYQGMHAACEALRQTEGPGTRPEGYLYRVAMEKKGVFGHGGVPIEYARAQVETPGREPWKHDWQRK